MRGFPLVVLALAGCGFELGGEMGEGVSEAAAQDQPAHLTDDLVAAAEGGADPQPDLLEAPSEPGSSGAPKIFYLHYADGKALPTTSPNPCRGTAPKFVCDFAPTLAECQREIQSYLDRWYADFNIVFTLVRPTSGRFYTEVISSGGGAWCDAAENVAGVAPFLCSDLAGGVAHTFRGGKNAKETAIIIAQEQAHLVGLEHTLSTRDIMDPTICPNCDGFENVDNRIQNDHCGRTRQNSYELMKERLGTWTGGIKPTPFGCQSDGVVPLVQILSPANEAGVSDKFVLRVQASDDCKVSRVSVDVAPMGLKAQSTAAPFEWTLTKISGRQTITVTAVDPSGKQSTSSVVVNAPGAGGGASGGAVPGDGDERAAGCDVGGCDVAGGPSSGNGTWVSMATSLALAAMLLMAARSRPRRPVRARPRR